MLTRRDFAERSAAFIVASGMKWPNWERALHSVIAPESSAERPLLLGVDYYPDQTPENLWEEDARMISEAGLTNVRVAEFAWSLMEPSEGQFDFAWLKRSVGILHKHGIAVILGTPSAAPPPWLTEKYPEILMVNSEGMTVHPGGRRFTCPSNRTYRSLSLRIATEMAKNFADTPGVIGWQIDNEFTLQSFGRCYCKYCREGFQDWARQKYGSLDSLNQKWGTAFWSQIYTDWAQIPVPLPSNGPPNPGLALDYDRYQSYANASFAGEQIGMLRKQCPHDFLTTNSVGAPFDTLNLRELYRDLDFVSDDNYPGFAAMFMPGEITPEKLAVASAIGHDSMRSVKGGKPYLIMEEQSGKAGQQSFSPQPHPGELRLWAFQAIAHGAMGVNYFRWDTARFGAEEYWHGLLNHDRSKSPGFDEIIGTVKDVKALGRELLESSYVAETALSFDQDCDWALQVQPGHAKLTYRDQLMKWYGAVAAANTGTDLIHLDEDLSKYKAVFAPVQYVLSQRQADNVKQYVQNGGMFVAGFRLGVKDENSQIVNMPLPGLLREVMGTRLKDYVPIYSEKLDVIFESQMAGPEGKCGLWADLLVPAAATSLAKYSGAYEGAAITINDFGKGKAVYIGADLDPESLSRVLGTLLSMVRSKSEFEVPNGVEVTRRRVGQKQWFFLLNHATVSQKVTLPSKFKSVMGSESFDGTLELKPYEVAILQRA